jgi:DNA-binding Lrp family transcriptional regulator
MTLAFVFVECAKNAASSVEGAAKQVKGVLEAYLLKDDSDFDLVVKVQTPDESQFRDAISSLKSIAGVAAIVTTIAYSSFH